MDSGRADPSEPCSCPSNVRDSVHDLLDGLRGSVAKSWEDKSATIRWFVAAGAPEALLRHGWRFDWWVDDRYPRWAGCLVERIDVGGEATPAQVFLQAYEVTWSRDHWVACPELRGHWHAEHVSLPVAQRDGGIKLLLSMGATRGRVKGVGGVLRGVRRLEPMTVDEIAEAFA